METKEIQRKYQMLTSNFRPTFGDMEGIRAMKLMQKIANTSEEIEKLRLQELVINLIEQSKSNK